MIEAKIDSMTGVAHFKGVGNQIALAAEIGLIVGEVYASIAGQDANAAAAFRLCVEAALSHDSPVWDVAANAKNRKAVVVSGFAPADREEAADGA